MPLVFRGHQTIFADDCSDESGHAPATAGAQLAALLSTAVAVTHLSCSRVIQQGLQRTLRTTALVATTAMALDTATAVVAFALMVALRSRCRTADYAGEESYEQQLCREMTRYLLLSCTLLAWHGFVSVHVRARALALAAVPTLPPLHGVT